MTRAFKNVSDDGGITYEIRNAGVQDKVNQNVTFEGCQFVVTTGDYQPLLKLVNKYLSKAQVLQNLYLIKIL